MTLDSLIQVIYRGCTGIDDVSKCIRLLRKVKQIRMEKMRIGLISRRLRVIRLQEESVYRVVQPEDKDYALILEMKDKIIKLIWEIFQEV